MLFGKYFPRHNVVLSAALANVFIDCVMHYVHACRAVPCRDMSVNVSLTFCATRGRPATYIKYISSHQTAYSTTLAGSRMLPPMSA